MKLPRFSTSLLSSFAISAFALSAFASPTPPSPTSLTNTPTPLSLEQRAYAAIAKGANWLIECQSDNGAWSNPTFPALSAMPAWALSAAGVNQTPVKKATEFIRSCAQPDGGIYVVVPGRRGGALGTYNTAICMTALHYADNLASTKIIQKAREYVASTQLEGDDSVNSSAGGFGYEKNSPGGYADLNNSAWAISAMRITQDVEDLRPDNEKRVDIDWDAALAFVEKMQVKPNDPNTSPEDIGGFLYKRENGTPPTPPSNGTSPQKTTLSSGKRPPLRSYGSITYSGLEAMIFAQVSRSDPRVVSAIDYARRHWTVDENPGMGQQGIYYYYTIMARALSLLDINELPAIDQTSPSIRWRDELIEKVLSLQKANGSWSNANNRFWENDPVLSTSYAMLTLEYALRLFR